MGVKVIKNDVPLKNLLQMHENGEINFHMAIQREYVWSVEQASMLIDSFLQGLPVPPVFSWDKGDEVHHMMDGLQRTTSIIRFLKGEFALDAEELEPITYVQKKGADPVTVDTSNMKFSDLPDYLQTKLLHSTITFNVVKKDATESRTEDELQETIFRNLNSGSALTKMELTTALASGKVMEFVNELRESHFFKNVININQTWRTRQADREVILQTAMLVSSPEVTAISGAKVRKFAIGMKDDGVPQEIADKMRTTTEYLGNAIPKFMDNLKKVHVPMIFLMAVKAIEMNIAPSKFGGWVQGFFERLDKSNKNRPIYLIKYVESSKGGTAKKEAVENRVKGASEDFKAEIWNADTYYVPSTPVDPPANNPDTTPVVSAEGQTAEEMEKVASDNQDGSANPIVDTTPIEEVAAGIDVAAD